jgi:hypothetical protein
MLYIQTLSCQIAQAVKHVVDPQLSVDLKAWMADVTTPAAAAHCRTAH